MSWLRPCEHGNLILITVDGNQMKQPALILGLIFLLAGCDPSFDYEATEAKVRTITAGWPEYGGGNGQRFVPDTLIDKSNVADLKLAWVYRTGDVAEPGNPKFRSTSAFEVTPITAEGKLIFCSVFNKVIALDPVTGGEIWKFDPDIDLSASYSNQLICRGVSYWKDTAAASDATCASRIFTATNDGYLIALDTTTGAVCRGFGNDGRIDLNKGVGDQEWLGEYHMTSPPAVVSDLVVVGAAISDNVRIDAPSGVIRAFDARSGEQRWAFDLAPPDFDYENGLVSDEGFALGTPNVWGPMSVDRERDLLFVPTGNPSPDYYRTGKPDMDYYGTAVVALRGSTGEVVWHFNTVINDFWDYDVGGQPTLSDLTIDGKKVPALIQGTKMGFVFVLNRETGEPIVDIEMKSVPREGPLADQLSPVQPFPPEAFRVAAEVSREDAWGVTPFDKSACEDVFETSRVGPIYTPITEEWTIVAPGNGGGINWGGVAVDPERGLIATRSSNLPWIVKLIPRDEFSRAMGHEWGVEVAEQRGLPFAMARNILQSPLGLLCNKPPWGVLTVIDIAREQQVWQVPHGTVRDVSPVPIPIRYGVPGLGAPIITSTGVILVAGAAENVIRALDVDSGEELWQHRLPATPLATPMSYTVASDAGEVNSFVIIAAGGHGRAPAHMGDYLVAFSLN